jgi:hypothetical protein
MPPDGVHWGVRSPGSWVFLPFYVCGFEAKNKIGSSCPTILKSVFVKLMY